MQTPIKCRRCGEPVEWFIDLDADGTAPCDACANAEHEEAWQRHYEAEAAAHDEYYYKSEDSFLMAGQAGRSL